MIVLKATQDKVLAALQSVAGIVERRHTLPILANVLIQSRHSRCVHDSGQAQTHSLLDTKKYDIQTHHPVT